GNGTALRTGDNTSSNSMTFAFSANDTGGNQGKGVGINHFECNIDNSKFVTCTSPFTFPKLLNDGTHTFNVLSIDNSRNKDTSPSLFTWTVDTSPPATTIDSATDGNNRVITAGGNTSSNSMIFLFSSIDSGVGVDHSECSIDNSKFTVCTSPLQFTSTNLGDGTHTLKILSDDKVGNKASAPSSFNWTVDTVPPKTSINSATDGNKSAVTNAGNTKSTSMTFAFSGNDTGGIGIDHFECSTDKSDFVTCTSPFTLPNSMKDGSHTFRVLSEDKVGNRGSSPASINWTVDTVPPSTTIDSVRDGNKSSLITGGNSSSNSTIITFSGIDTGGNQGKGVGINHFECSLDGASFSTCSAPLELKELKDGAHLIEIKASDNVGNNDPTPSSFSWTIDTAPPTTSITSAIDGNRKTVTAGEIGRAHV